MSDEQTLDFYARNAAEYARHVEGPTARLSGFLAALPARARILELGCGNGRDSLQMLAEGFDVDPTDGSPQLAAEAERRLGRTVRVLRFVDLDAEQAYDGIWACASLLHEPAASLPAVLARIHAALRPGGVFVASFKAGSGEGRDRLGRYFNYPSPEMLAQIYEAAGWDHPLIEQQPGTGYDARPTQWLWVTART